MKTTNDEFKVIKFFSPLKIQTYDNDENEPSEISSSMANCYANNIIKAIEKSRIPCETDKGLMEYFDENKMVAEKVTYAYPTVESYNCELFGVLVTHVKGELDDHEIKVLTEYFSGQYSDGWGEGFEQHPIKTDDGDIYVSFWHSGNAYFIIPEDEFKNSLEQEQTSLQRGGMD